MGKPGRSWWRERGPGLAVGLVLIAAGLVTMMFWRSGTRGAEKANVLAFPAAVVGVVVTVWQVRPRPGLGRVARSLARAVITDRTGFLAQALGPRSGQFRGA